MMKYQKCKLKLTMSKIAVSIFFISAIICSCKNSTEPAKNTPSKYAKIWSVDEIFELQSLENQIAIQKLESFGYKYELDLNKEGTLCSVYAFDLQEDKTATQRICIGSRDGKKYFSVRGYDNYGSRLFKSIKDDCEKIGVKRKAKYQSTSNVPCEEWNVKNKVVNFCDGVEHGHAIYLVEVLE